MIRDSIRFLFFSICIVTVLSCNEKKQNRDKIKLLESVVENTLNEKLNLPQNLEVYTPFSNYLVDECNIFNSEYQIYSRVDASCGTCIGDINKWNELINEFYKYKVPIILICSSDDNFELIKYLCETGKIKDFKYPLFLDKNNEFVKNNNFMASDINFETVLTDKNRSIIALGSPVYSTGIKDIYIKEIKKRLSSH